jgi:antitoxin HigA-1
MARTPTHPGEILAEELEVLGVSPTELSRQIRVPPNRISQIINGKRAITGDTAVRFAHWFGTSPQFWMNLQALYEVRLAQQQAGAEIRALPTRQGASTAPRLRRLGMKPEAKRPGHFKYRCKTRIAVRAERSIQALSAQTRFLCDQRHALSTSHITQGTGDTRDIIGRILQPHVQIGGHLLRGPKMLSHIVGGCPHLCPLRRRFRHGRHSPYSRFSCRALAMSRACEDLFPPINSNKSRSPRKA